MGTEHDEQTAADECGFDLHFVCSRAGDAGRAETFSAVQDATKKLHALFDDEWQWALREFPEFATRIGDPRYNDRLTDMTAPALRHVRRTHAICSSEFAKSIAPA